jgi:hypothetical protein
VAQASKRDRPVPAKTSSMPNSKKSILATARRLEALTLQANARR